MSSTATTLIYLTEYDPLWPQLFTKEAAQIAEALKVPISSVHHVGSTSVPGLRAKPLIDMVVTVHALGIKDDYLKLLAPLGYSYRDVHDSGRLFYEKRLPHRFHIHLVEEDGWHFWRMVLFRDRLREDPLTASAYVELKRRLAEQHPDDRDMYSGGKSFFVTRCVAAELRRHPDLAARLKAAGAPVDKPFEHKRDPDTESFTFR
jgi:GrpB-like predicted nucleotidyltransferase (UPF0157 family)